MRMLSAEPPWRPVRPHSAYGSRASSIGWTAWSPAGPGHPATRRRLIRAARGDPRGGVAPVRAGGGDPRAPRIPSRGTGRCEQRACGGIRRSGCGGSRKPFVVHLRDTVDRAALGSVGYSPHESAGASAGGRRGGQLPDDAGDGVAVPSLASGDRRHPERVRAAPRIGGPGRRASPVRSGSACSPGSTPGRARLF